MAEYMNKDRFLASMGLKGDETKYGNRDAEHQHKSYSTYMAYEIMDSVEDSIEEDVAPVVHAKWKPKYDKKDGYWHNICSACKVEAPFEYKYEPDYDEGLDGEWHYIGQMECGIREYPTNYCPNCGAKMDGE